MLELRPACEHCNKSLPPHSTEAMICTFECTFCTQCVKGVLEKVCPNCGGNFQPRPVRPQGKLEKFPASQKVVHKPVDLEKHRAFINDIKEVPPEHR